MAPANRPVERKHQYARLAGANGLFDPIEPRDGKTSTPRQPQ